MENISVYSAIQANDHSHWTGSEANVIQQRYNEAVCITQILMAHANTKEWEK